MSPEASLGDTSTEVEAGPAQLMEATCSAADAGDLWIATHDVATVLVENYTNPDNPRETLSIAFQPSGTVIAPSVCTMTTVGPCQVSALCDLDLGGPTCIAPNAGAITLGDDGDAGSSTTTIEPSAPPPSSGGGGGEYPLVDSPPEFVGGDFLTVTAEGGVVPAFAASLVAPSYVTLIDPAPPHGAASGQYVIPTSSDLAVSWVGGEANATVHVVLRALQNTEAPDTFVVDCSFDGLAGKGIVPQAALSRLKIPHPLASDLVVYQQRVTSVQAGTFVVQIVVRNACDSSAGALVGPCFVNNLRAILE